MDYQLFRGKFSERIIALRLQKNLSSRQLSQELNQCPSYINKIENGLAMPSMDMLFKICEYFEITPAEFFNDSVENPYAVKELTRLYCSLNCDNARLLMELAQKLSISEQIANVSKKSNRRK